VNGAKKAARERQAGESGGGERGDGKEEDEDDEFEGGERNRRVLERARKASDHEREVRLEDTELATEVGTFNGNGISGNGDRGEQSGVKVTSQAAATVAKPAVPQHSSHKAIKRHSSALDINMHAIRKVMGYDIPMSCASLSIHFCTRYVHYKSFQKKQSKSISCGQATAILAFGGFS
jgi:hypothetical protein